MKTKNFMGMVMVMLVWPLVVFADFPNTKGPRVQSVQNSVDVRSVDGITHHNLQNNEIIQIGDRLTSGQNAGYTLDMGTKSVIVKGIQTTILGYEVPEQIEISGRAMFVLHEGTVYLRREGSTDDDRLTLYTPTVVVMLKGTTTSEAIVSIRDPQHTDLFVEKGWASIRGLSSSVDALGVSLPGGWMTTIDEKSAATDPREFKPSELPRISTTTESKQESQKNTPIILGGIAILGIIVGGFFGRRRARLV